MSRFGGVSGSTVLVAGVAFAFLLSNLGQSFQSDINHNLLAPLSGLSWDTVRAFGQGSFAGGGPLYFALARLYNLVLPVGPAAYVWNMVVLPGLVLIWAYHATAATGMRELAPYVVLVAAVYVTPEWPTDNNLAYFLSFPVFLYALAIWLRKPPAHALPLLAFALAVAVQVHLTFALLAVPLAGLLVARRSVLRPAQVALAAGVFVVTMAPFWPTCPLFNRGDLSTLTTDTASWFEPLGPLALVRRALAPLAHLYNWVAVVIVFTFVSRAGREYRKPVLFALAWAVVPMLVIASYQGDGARLSDYRFNPVAGASCVVLAIGLMHVTKWTDRWTGRFLSPASVGALLVLLVNSGGLMPVRFPTLEGNGFAAACERHVRSVRYFRTVERIRATDLFEQRAPRDLHGSAYPYTRAPSYVLRDWSGRGRANRPDVLTIEFVDPAPVPGAQSGGAGIRVSIIPRYFSYSETTTGSRGQESGRGPGGHPALRYEHRICYRVDNPHNLDPGCFELLFAVRDHFDTEAAEAAATSSEGRSSGLIALDMAPAYEHYVYKMRFPSPGPTRKICVDVVSEAPWFGDVDMYLPAACVPGVESTLLPLD